MKTYIKRGKASTVDEFIKGAKAYEHEEYVFDAKDAVKLIREAIENHDVITIIGDYDCDGVCATAIMATAISALGDRPKVRLPLRFTEGYGMKPSMTAEIESGLVVTVDNGIAAFDAIKAAKEKGLKVLVTDHHGVMTKTAPAIKDDKIEVETSAILPCADCIVNPHIEETLNEDGHYDFYDYCGAGVALKIAEKLLGKEHPVMDKLYAYAALATIADVMPVTGDNRNIVIRGTRAMANGATSIGFQQLLAQNKIDTSDIPSGLPPHVVITSDVLGYRLAPCINAASRLLDDGALLALRSIASETAPTAVIRTSRLIELNEKRKRITEKEQTSVDRIIAENHMERDCPLVIYLPDSAPGIIGLHAGRLCEIYQVPVVVINGHGDTCKGSCRSVEGADMKALLDSVSDCLIAYGGHPGAAGLTINEENIDRLREALKQRCKELAIKPKTTDKTYFDIRLTATDVPRAAEVLTDALAPFGEGNPEPVFLVTMRVEDVRILGGKHLKIYGDGIEGIGFNLGGEGCLPEGFKSGQNATFLATIGYNVFRGVAKPQLGIIEVIDPKALIIDDPSKADDEHTTGIDPSDYDAHADR